ncbi:alpha/beta hydrolase [Alphaproteobacteria bacterium]|nr:alpha/beta hydrolase [Alphaproteobacteria bacterium]
MTDTPLSYNAPKLEKDERILSRADDTTIAYHKLDGQGPGIVFLGGLRSDMTGTKAQALENYCREENRAFVRFDYFGHGSSSGDFAEGTIGRWTKDAICVLDEITNGPQILIGSSMGGWIMLLAAIARPDRVAALIGIAAAPDFTETLLWKNYPKDVQETLRRDGVYFQPTPYEEGPYAITMKLIENGRRHLLLESAIDINCPVHLIQGMMDDAVPWQHALAISKNLASTRVTITLVKDGDHRLSRDEDLARLMRIVDAVCDGLHI